MKRNSNKRQFSINGTKYTVRLTNIHYDAKMSDETNWFFATLEIKVNGDTYLISCKNDGYGGETDINKYATAPIERVCDILQDYLKSVPNQNFIDYMKDICGIDIDSTDSQYYYTLETLVDELVEECITE